MTILLAVMAVAIVVFTVLSIWNGALAASGLCWFKPDGSAGLGYRYHTFAQYVWLALAIIWTIGYYLIIFGAGLA